VAQGFPASRTAPDEIDVLFPATPAVFGPAVELDLWSARHAAIVVSVVAERACR
jgi:hypothetical protein